MQALGVVQQGADILTRPAVPFDLPAEHEVASAVVDRLLAAANQISRVHAFAKGMGLAAPQIGIARAAAIILPAGGDSAPIILLNPVVTEVSEETDEQYEGCLSFFDVRGMVPRPLHLDIEHSTYDGHQTITRFDNGLARLVAHEVDHLCGRLYTSRMRPCVQPIPVEEYRGTGQPWTTRR
ncbi:peptide deformylase [Streptosporangium saharense]|uniref:peptide deformylase n=1 Tax=Streptosporangium saharense TaxID=1706840 RepID=UPI0036A154CC